MRPSEKKDVTVFSHNKSDVLTSTLNMAGESEDDVDAMDMDVNREREGETNRIVRNLLAGRPNLEYAQVFEDSMIAPYDLKNLNAHFLFREMGVPCGRLWT